MRKRNPGFIRSGAFKELNRTLYRRRVLELVQAVIPDIEAPTPDDFWPAVDYLMSEGTHTADQAAAKMIEHYRSRKINNHNQPSAANGEESPRRFVRDGNW